MARRSMSRSPVRYPMDDSNRSRSNSITSGSSRSRSCSPVDPVRLRSRSPAVFHHNESESKSKVEPQKKPSFEIPGLQWSTSVLFDALFPILEKLSIYAVVSNFQDHPLAHHGYMDADQLQSRLVVLSDSDFVRDMLNKHMPLEKRHRPTDKFIDVRRFFSACLDSTPLHVNTICMDWVNTMCSLNSFVPLRYLGSGDYAVVFSGYDEKQWDEKGDERPDIVACKLRVLSMTPSESEREYREAEQEAAIQNEFAKHRLGVPVHRTFRRKAQCHVHVEVVNPMSELLSSKRRKPMHSSEMELYRLVPMIVHGTIMPIVPATLDKWLSEQLHSRELLTVLAEDLVDLLNRIAQIGTHGDLHPGNIVVNSVGKRFSLSLIDFGFASTHVVEPSIDWLQLLRLTSPNLEHIHANSRNNHAILHPLLHSHFLVWREHAPHVHKNSRIRLPPSLDYFNEEALWNCFNDIHVRYRKLLLPS